MPKPQPHILLNAMHTVTGGGLIYLTHLLPHLAASTQFRFTLLLHPHVLGAFPVPAGVTIRTCPTFPFGISHLWEQLVLPILARSWGVHAVWSNANYGPLLAPRAMVTIHTNTRAAASWQGAKARLYWALVKRLTQLSLWRAPAAFTVAAHVVPHYVGPRTGRRIHVAPPAVAATTAYGHTRTPHQLVAVGDVYAQKQYPLLISIVAKLREQLPTATLLLIGRPTQPQAVADLHAAITQHNLQSAITWLQGAPHAQVMQHLAQASAFINVSSAECFNMPVLEALSQGTPVIVPDTAFQREVAADAAIYVPTDKGGDLPAAFAVAALAALTNPSIHTMFSRRGLLRAQQFSWAHTARTKLQVFQSVIKKEYK